MLCGAAGQLKYVSEVLGLCRDPGRFRQPNAGARLDSALAISHNLAVVSWADSLGRYWGINLNAVWGRS